MPGTGYQYNADLRPAPSEWPVTRDLFRPVALGIYFLSFAIGVIGALVLPTFSVFLAKELGVRPLLVGIPYAGIALGSIVYNQWIGYLSDRISDRRPLVVSFCLVGALACAVFALSRNYWLVVSTAVFLLSLGMVAFSQMLAYSMEYAERHFPPERVALFNAIVRAQVAVAWVAGPPAGFLLASYFGFTSMYTLAALLFVGSALLALPFLPRLDRMAEKAGRKKEPLPLTPEQKRALWLCLGGFSLMWCANNSYLISLPLHLSLNLGIGTEWAGWMMGLCALLEVPVMIMAGILAARVRLLALVRLASGVGLILYAGVFWSQTLWQLFALQLFNAIFIGVLAGLGISVIQQLLPGRAGSASAFFTNSTHLGNLLSSISIGVVAELYGYRSVFLVNLLVVALAMVAFFRVRAER